MASKSTTIVLNGSGGAFTDVPVSMACKRMEIREDSGGAGPQGLTYQDYLDNFASTKNIDPSAQPLIYGNTSASDSRFTMLGYPAQSGPGGTVAAFKVAKLKSFSVNATTIIVTEFDR